MYLTPNHDIPIASIALDAHQRSSGWAGLSEAGQILAEAEARKGEVLTLAELHAVMVAHLDTYDPGWHFGQAGISDAWMSGWEHAFALYGRQITRLCDPEPVHGIGLVFRPRPDGSPTETDQLPRQTVRFGKTRLQVADLDAFWQGVSEGQSVPIGPLSTARYYDDVLDLVHETSNYGLDFVVGYVLGTSSMLLAGSGTPTLA